MKKCSSCSQEKEITEFYRNTKTKDGLRSNCKECCGKTTKNYKLKNKENYIKIAKNYYEQNKDKIKNRSNLYYIKNKDNPEYIEKRRQNLRRYYRLNPEKVAEQLKKLGTMKYKPNAENRKNYLKKYRELNREKLNAHYRKKRMENAHYHLRKTISQAIREKLKIRILKKNGKTSFDGILSYSAEDLKVHLESLFAEGMTWENYGAGEGKWHIDHKTPDSWFTYSSVDDDGFKKSWALENLQPMWGTDNIKKGNKYSG